MKKTTTKDIYKILEKMGSSVNKDAVSAIPFTSEEDGAEYAVWKVTVENTDYVLKEAKGDEAKIYSAYLNIKSSAIPHLYAVTRYEGRDYLLMEYVSGRPLLRLDRSSLTHTLDALIDLQKRYWGAHESTDVAIDFEQSLAHRIERGKHLNDATLEEAYCRYLEQFQSLPRTLCHDDLLPFNVIEAEHRAVLIDWEVTGILPYPTSLARLLAHGESSPDAFFYLTEEDRAFAIAYYYENLIREKGISYEEYLRSLDYCFLYEYCEWVMLGNKYGDTETDRFKRYLALAKVLAQKLIQ